ncbi:MAG: outer membrane protein assembly factor BamD [Bacteroidales bacterium]|nr:outer membrane protein assembly factor BamD [Bacteroidales bacterium]
MKNFCTKIAVLITVASLVTSCSGYSKLLKGNDYDLKYTKAFEYYNLKKYDKALQLFEQILPVYKGMDKGEKVLYYYTMTNYLLKDYYVAGYYFRKFVQTYPHSLYAEQSMYLGAYCYYLDSPKPSLDQESTNMAINEFELFLAKYPNTPKKDTCNALLDELRLKLQTKSFNNAHLYYQLGYYKAGVIAQKNSLKAYPDTPFREDLLYYTAKSAYIYADRSIDEKKYERFLNAKSEIADYLKAYPSGRYVKDVNKMQNNTQENLTLYQ